jgi:hypothetical protein
VAGREESGRTVRSHPRPSPGSPRVEAALFGLVVSILLAVYVATLLPGVGGQEDSPKFQWVGPALGTPHNPGNPLYMLAAYAASRVPLGSVAYRVNLLSAVWGALTGGLAFAAMRSLGVRRSVAVAMAIALGLGRFCWTNAVFAEVYTQTAACAAGAYAALLRWDATGRERWLYASIAAASLAFGTHMVIVGAVPALAVFALSGMRWRPRPRVLAAASSIVLAGMAQYLYVLVRTRQHAVFLESKATNLRELLDVMLARQFPGQTFSEPFALILRTHVPDILHAGLAELGVAACLAAGAGAVGLAVSRPRVAALLVLGAAGPAAFIAMLGGVGMNATGGMLLVSTVPAWLLAAVATSAGVAAVDRGGLPRWRHVTAGVLTLVVFCVPVTQARANLGIADRHRDVWAGDFAAALFDAFPDRAAVIDEPDQWTSHVARYQQFVSGAAGVRLGIPPEPEAVLRLLADGVAVFALGRGFDTLDGRVGLSPVALLARSFDERMARLPDGIVVVVAGRAWKWPAMPALGVRSPEPRGGSGVVIGVKGRRPAFVSAESFEGAVRFSRGDVMGESSRIAPTDIRVELTGRRASIFVDDEEVVATEDGLAVAEIGERLHAAYVAGPQTSFRPGIDARVPAYRVTGPRSADACAAIGDAGWTRLEARAENGRIIGRIRNTIPLDTSWQAWVTSSTPLAARLGGPEGSGNPVLSVETFVRGHDETALAARLTDDGLPARDFLRNAAFASRIDVRLDACVGCTFRINLGSRPDGVWARTAGERADVRRGEVCAGDVPVLAPDPGSRLALVYLGPGGDAAFGAGWRGPEQSPAGFRRRSRGPEASMFVRLGTPAALTLHLSAAPLGGALDAEVRVNGHALPPQLLQPGWNDLAVPVPLDVWLPGSNDIVIRVTRGQAPALLVRRFALEWQEPDGPPSAAVGPPSVTSPPRGRSSSGWR